MPQKVNLKQKQSSELVALSCICQNPVVPLCQSKAESGRCQKGRLGKPQEADEAHGVSENCTAKLRSFFENKVKETDCSCQEILGIFPMISSTYAILNCSPVPC